MHDLVSNFDSELEWSLGGLMDLDILHLISPCLLMIMSSFIPGTGTDTCYNSINTPHISLASCPGTTGLLHDTLSF